MGAGPGERTVSLAVEPRLPEQPCGQAGELLFVEGGGGLKALPEKWMPRLQKKPQADQGR